MRNTLYTILISVTLSMTSTAFDGHKIKGEILPDLAKNNLIKNGDFKQGISFWKFINPAENAKVYKVKIKNYPAITIARKSDQGFAALVSDPYTVKPGKKYFTTALYNCEQAKFGTFAKIVVVPYKKLDSFLQRLQDETPYVSMGKHEVLSRKRGAWMRKTGQYTVPQNVNKVCMVIVQYGTKSTITYSSVYLGAFPEKRFFDKSKYYSDYEPATPQAELNKIYAARKAATASVVKFGDVPAFKLNGKITAPLIYFGDAFTPKRSKLQAFQQAGINLQILSLNRNRKFWKSKEEYDFKKIDKYLSDAISINPQGNFIILLDVSPYLSWSDEYPEHVAMHVDGKPATGRHGRKAPPSYWSELYRKQSFEFVKAVVSYLKTRPYYKCIAGFFLSGNEDGQFYYNSIGKTLHNGQSPAAVTAFRKWLKARYGNIAALRKAWRQPKITFETITAPVKAERVGSTFLNPATQKNYIDFIKFLNESMASFANQLCRTAKDAAGKEVLTVMWWGRGAAQLVYPHFGQSKIVFPASDMDVMGSQAGYHGERENARTCFMPWVYDSARLHNKITMLEADFRTWKSPLKSMQHDYHIARYWNLYDLKGALLRDFGKQIAVGGGLWWYDMSAGWFKDPEIMRLAKEMSDAAGKLYNKPAKVSPAKIALVVDEQNFYRTTEQIDIWNGPNYHALRLGQRAFLRSGLKYDLIYFDDIIAENRDNYKVYIFMNSWMISDKQRNFIENKLKAKGKTLIWLYASGYLTKNGFSLENMHKLTGIKLLQSGNVVHGASFVTASEQLVKGLGAKVAGMGTAMYGPRFVVKDKGAQSLARYPDGKIAMAVKKMPGWSSIYIGNPSGFSPEFLQNIARFAGVHVYNTPGDMFVYHRDDLICLHGVEGNTNKLRFPDKVNISDLFSGRELMNKGTTLKVKLKPGETRLLRLIKVKDK